MELGFHKDEPVSHSSASADLAVERFFWGEREHVAPRHLGFVPLKNQGAVWPQDAEALRKSLAQVIAPVRT